MQSNPDVKSLFSDYVKTLETYIMVRIAQRTAELTPELKAKNRTPINLSIGAPIQPPPNIVFETLKNSLSEPGISTYSMPRGEAFFLDAIAQRMKKRFGVELDAKTEIFSLIGSKEGLANMFRCVVNPSLDPKEQDIIMIPDPGYASYNEQIKVIGAKSYPIPLTYENNFMPDPEKVMENLEKEGLSPEKARAFVVNYPNNPLGATATRDYLQKVVNFCRQRNILLISDAAYADMYFAGQEAPASILEFEGAKDIAVEFHSLSKPYSMTGWRAGWVCGNKDIVGVLGKMKSTVDTGIFKGIQKAAAAVLTSEEGDNYISECNKKLEIKQKTLVNGFRELGWDIDNLIIPKATFYLWLPIPPRFNSSVEFCNQVLEKSGVVIVPGTAFGKCGEGFFRLSMSLPKESLCEVIDRLKEDGFSYGSN